MAYNTVIIKGEPVRDERLANAAITPGMLIELMSTNKVRAHATAGGTAERTFAIENENAGEDLDTAYAAGDVCLFGTFKPGDEVNALLANGEDIDIGDKLESNGDGYLREVDADASVGAVAVGSVLAVALEALDMSGSSGVDPASQRLRVRIM
jgi:hypothetical protein